MCSNLCIDYKIFLLRFIPAPGRAEKLSPDSSNPLLGVTAIVSGALARQWAISTLGRSFTLDVRVSDDQLVITGGPYRWVRHPSYTADILAFTGIGLALGNWLSLLAAAILPLLGLLVRIHVEEAALMTNLGEPYHAFADGKKRLIPRVW